MVMIPQSTHAQRAAYNAKNGAGAWGASIGKPAAAPAPMIPVGNTATPRPMAPPPASTHAERAAYNAKNGAGAWAQHIGKTPAPVGPGQVVTAATPAPNTPAVAPAAPAAPAAPTAPPVDPNQLARNLFPSENIFEPKNFQGSPLYQFQVKSGLDQVNKSLAKRGLQNSGEGIRQELNVPMMAAAQDTDRMTRLATDNANRLQTMQQNETLRQERAGNDQWNRSFSLAELMGRQDPWQGALGGLNSSAEATGAMGQDQANWLKSYYQKVLGGGSQGVPLQVPGGPDYSNIDPAQINGDYSSNNGWLSLLTKGLGSLFN